MSGKETRCQTGAKTLTSQIRKVTLRQHVAVFRPPKVLCRARQRYATKKTKKNVRSCSSKPTGSPIANQIVSTIHPIMMPTRAMKSDEPA